jgi:hypothetical protein
MQSPRQTHNKRLVIDGDRANTSTCAGRRSECSSHRQPDVANVAGDIRHLLPVASRRTGFQPVSATQLSPVRPDRLEACPTEEPGRLRVAAHNWVSRWP